ncbi:MAG TPA: hypothetical protein DEO70_12075 [Bacteroidales bacterium]|nr:MAG: hypothetical protein A2X11_10065 [Bacteroidetes bacterium GWE2_42_24]OFY25857.1 MAG: hypothetical protein A2X09_09440 [Bacteroidetes bacterium GWF2_43_11]HBZ67565.1 hypothetical protein [Bacteroidales bacterium]
MPQIRHPPTPIPDGSVLIRTGFLFGKPAIFISYNAITWRLRSTHASIYSQQKAFFILTQAINETITI